MLAELTDVANAGQLLSYASVAQIERVRHLRGLSQARIAELVGRPEGAFSSALTDPSDELLRGLDDVLIALVPDLARAGGLSALAVRLRRMESRATLTARIPPTWTGELLATPANGPFGLLTQGSALLSTLLAVPRRAKQICDDFGRTSDLNGLIERLVLVGVAPPTPRNVDAIILLGSIGGTAFHIVEQPLSQALKHNPLGFRVWRSITTLVRLNEHAVNSSGHIRTWTRIQLNNAELLRSSSLYPARSLDLELAIAIPPVWTAGGDDWAANVLRARAVNPAATVRERGTAALGLWERAIRHDGSAGLGETRENLERTRDDLARLNDEFRKEADKGDVALGLRWIADTLHQNLEAKQAVCNSWPSTEEPCLRIVREATAMLDDERSPCSVPARILTQTKRLVEHAILQNAGVYRRHALDTLLAGGWAKQVSLVLDEMLNRCAEPWLRCRILFALGFLQVRDEEVALTLRSACMQAKDAIDRAEPSRGIVSEMHAALFAVGDCFGATGAEAQARAIRQDLDPMLEELLEWSAGRESFYRVARAIGYVLLVTAQAVPSREFLRRLEGHPDAATQRIGTWAREHLLEEDGRARPLHAAR